MAYAQKTKANTEHPFRTIVKLINSDALPTVLLCHGHEEFLVNWAEKYVKGKLVEPAAEALDCTVFSEEADPYSIISACETLPILSKRKLETLQELERKFAPVSPAEAVARKEEEKKKAAFEERKQVNKIDRKKKNRISWLECEIAKLEEKMKQIEAVLAAPTEKDDIMELTRDYLECKRDLDAKTEEWGTLIE